MSLNLLNIKNKISKAVQEFWITRGVAKSKHQESGRLDKGERGSVTGGKNMEAFLQLIKDIVIDNGLSDAQFYTNKALLTLPGYFRPSKSWDILIMHNRQLIAVIELKSQVGPSFGNNFNNRAEEAIGSAHDFWIAYREGAFGQQSKPFLGWIMLVEDCPKSRAIVKLNSPHFSLFEIFEKSSYLQRYNILCSKLKSEHLYSSACLIATKNEAISNGEYTSVATESDVYNFFVELAGYIATYAEKRK